MLSKGRGGEKEGKGVDITTFQFLSFSMMANFEKYTQVQGTPKISKSKICSHSIFNCQR
jgi:hypothetical protein